jgi:hypothetical protein
VGGGDINAFYAKTAGKKGRSLDGNRSSNDGNRSNDKYCMHCNRKNHNTSDCCKLKKENEEKEKTTTTTTPSADNSGSTDSTTRVSIARTFPNNDIVHLF